MTLAKQAVRPVILLLIAVLLAFGFTAYQATAPNGKWVELTVPKADATTYIDIKNSVNSDYLIKVGNIYSGSTHVLAQGDHWNVWNSDGGARIWVYLSNSIDSYQYYYGGVWHACHRWITSNEANPTNDYSSVTIRTFYSGDCNGRN